MNAREFCQLLESLPETRLDILTIAQECTGPDGSIDQNAMLLDLERYDRAIRQANNYMNATQMLLNDLEQTRQQATPW